MRRQERYTRVLDHFRQHVGRQTTELDFGSAFQLLCATVLSAQCTDRRVNLVTPALFSRFGTPAAMASADVEEVLELVGSVSYPNAKARHLIGLAQMLVSDFGGEVPDQMDALTRLPGVGRKTANVVLAVWFGRATMAVDTHVYRVSHRLALVPASADTPRRVEDWLMRHIPETDIPDAHHWLLLHGRYVCTSQRPRCGECPFDAFCPKRIEGSKLA